MKRASAAEDVPSPVPGEIGLAGAQPPDIARYLNVRHATQPSLSPDGRSVAFLTSITGQPQLWVVTTSGDSWPLQLTFGESVTFADWSPDGSWIAYGTDRGGNEREGFYLISPDGAREAELLAPSEEFRTWGGWSRDGGRAAFTATEGASDIFAVFVIDIATKTIQRVFEGDLGIHVAAWRPDGNGLLLARTRAEDANDLLYLDLTSRRPETLFQPDDPTRYGSFAWLPDSGGFYLSCSEAREFTGLAYYDFASRQLEWIETPEHDVEGVALSGDGSLLAWSENVDGFSRVWLKDRSRGRNKRIELHAGVVGELTWADAVPRLAIQLTASQFPNDIWLYDDATGASVQITHSSTAGLVRDSFVTPEAVAFPSHDGETIFGLLYLPRTTSSRPPLVMTLHGGPTWQARPEFSAVQQYLLARGFAILDLNFRGSTGYGKRFTRLDNLRLRPNAVKDMQAAVEWLAGRTDVDASRIALMGGSYGGFMTLAGLTAFPDSFKGGVSMVGVSNWITALEGASPDLKASDRLEYGNIEDPADREFLTELSPLTHADRIRAPLMVIHGANDPRDPVEEADQIVAAIRARQGDVEYLRFPDEGHGIRKLSNRIIAYRRIAQFLERTLAGA